MNLEFWFPQPIWFEDTKADFSKDISFCKKLQSESSGREVSNRNGWQSDDIDIFAHEELKTVASIVNDKLNFLGNQLNKEKFNNIYVDNAWININKKHSYNIRHSHPMSAFSGCIYLKAPENSGKITFFRPDNKAFFPIPHDIFNPVFFNETFFIPKEGLVLIFPSWLEHEVSMSKADDDRISIAFNIGFK